MPDRAEDLEQLAAVCADAGHAGLAGWFAGQAEAETGGDVPDRAVVDEVVPSRPVLICPNCEGERYTLEDHDSWMESINCPVCDGKGYLPQPRALVALSDDQQWLVIHDGAFEWDIWNRRADIAYGYYDCIPDTGQDAHDVLAAWLEGRGG